MRLESKTAIVVGAGQTPGETVGNGRAAAILFAREGAKVLLVDRDLGLAQETEAMIKAEGGESSSLAADITREAECEAIAKACVDRYGRIDILHNNVGTAVGDGSDTDITAEGWHRIMDINLTGMMMTCKHVLPVMREQCGGSIIHISSIASICMLSGLAYKISKAGVNALSHAIAVKNAEYGIRSNVIQPGLIDTPMAIERRHREMGIDRAEIRAGRDAQVPLNAKMGSGWDIGYAALFLASDEAKFISGIELPVDGAQTARIG